MKTTPFTPFHIAAGARMVDFAGWNMPVEFTGINDEHLAVRNAAGLFDVSHMGEIWVRGPEAFNFLQNVATNDLSALNDGMAQYSCLTNDGGGIVDDVMVYCFGSEEYMLVVNASNTEKDWQHLLRHATAFGLREGEGLENASDTIAQVALQGPLAMKILQKVCDFNAVEMKPFRVVRSTVAGICGAIVATTGYTGSGGCEIFVPAAEAARLWEALHKAGAEFGMKDIGLGARDTLRLEKGYCLYGNDLDDTTSPIEAGLKWVVKLLPGKDFPGLVRIEKEYSGGVSRRLVGFKMVERGIPRHGYALAAPSGEIIGHVTSGTMSPMLHEGIGMGYVAAQYAAAETPIAVIIRDRPVAARIVKPPFA